MIELELIQRPPYRRALPGAKDGSIILAWLVPAGAKSKANIKLFPLLGGQCKKDLTGEINREQRGPKGDRVYETQSPIGLRVLERQH